MSPPDVVKTSSGTTKTEAKAKMHTVQANIAYTFFITVIIFTSKTTP